MSIPTTRIATAVEREVAYQPLPEVLRFPILNFDADHLEYYTYGEMHRVNYLFTGEVRGVPSTSWVDPIATAEVGIHGVRVLRGYVTYGYRCGRCHKVFFAATLEGYRHECHEGVTEA